MNNILILGGAGFIGMNLCNKLKNNNITIFDNFSEQIHGKNPKIPTNIDVHIGDVSNKSDWNYLKNKNFDTIIHLAAETGTGQSMYEAEKYCKVNIGSMAILNDLITDKQIKCNKIILASSRSVYGEAQLDSFNEPISSSEFDITNPISIYGVTKLSQEMLLLAGFDGIKKCILRLQNVYGPGQSGTNPYTGIITIFITEAINGKNLNIFEDGKMSRDFIHIDDVTKSILFCLDKDINGIFNIGTGNKSTILEIANIIADEFNVKVNINGLKRTGDIRHNYANISKIKELGYNPEISLIDGLRELLKISKKMKYQSALSNSLEELKEKGLLK